MIIQFDKNDVARLANFILASGTLDIDRSGSRSKSGLWYCADCGEYEKYPYTDGIKHKHDCIVKVAQDVLTRIDE